MRHPWLLDASLSDRISTYSAAFARLVKSSQALFTGPLKSSIPNHGTGTFFVTDDPNEEGGTFEYFRSRQHWLYTIDHRNDPAAGISKESPNELEITATTWALYRNDRKTRLKIAGGDLQGQEEQ